MKKYGEKMVPRAGIEPARDEIPRDFKSLASTCSATAAYVMCLKCAPSYKKKLINKYLEAEVGIEPASTALQAAA